MSYSIIRCQKTYDEAMKLTRGCYQQNILKGIEAMSGATLRGKAKKYIGRYRQSAQNFIQRCQDNGLDVREDVGSYNKRLLVVG